MPGFTSITGDESIMFADNASFDGTQRNGKITSDGQQWIGSDVSPHVRVGKITSLDGSVIITFGHGTIDLAVPNSGGGGMCNKLVAATKFLTSGMWTKNPATNCLRVYIWNGGGGGGSGRRGASAGAGGGSGGGNGGLCIYNGLASFFGATETVTVGAGGVGGASVLVDATNGNDGANGGKSSFGNITGSLPVAANNTQGGGGGKNGNASAGLGETGSYIYNFIDDGITQSFDIAGSTGGAGNTGPGSSSTDSGYTAGYSIATGGGAGGGADSGTERSAGNGGGVLSLGISSGSPNSYFIAQAAGGIESGTVNGANGVAGIIGLTGGVIISGTGAGGGGGMKSIGPGTGGLGGSPGGGGGGGGGSLTGTNSGAGGNGGDGMVYILEFA